MPRLLEAISERCAALPIRSRRDRFDDAVWRRGWHDSREPEARGREERRELLFGPLVPSEHREHLQVLQQGGGRCLARPQHLFEDQHFARWRHGLSAVLQNLDTALIVPGMQDLLEQVGIRPSWHTLEKAPAY